MISFTEYITRHKLSIDHPDDETLARSCYADYKKLCADYSVYYSGNTTQVPKPKE